MASQKENKKNPGGRPTKFKEEYIEQAAKLCELGATDKQLASFFKVNESTIHQWKIDQPKFSESLKIAKDELDRKVERSLFERATGYKHSEDKIFNNNGESLIVPTTKHYPPDTTALIFWLKNRQPSKWRDRVETKHSGGVGVVDMSECSDEELKRIIDGD